MQLSEVSQQIGEQLLQENQMLVTAESCTGGWVAQNLTAIAGSSRWFERGFITYSNEAKQEMLGVKQETLEQYGAVSEATVMEMTQGALQNSHAQVAVAISGIAGPTGGSAQKPVGTVCIAWALSDTQVFAETKLFHGDREVIRKLAVQYALEQLLLKLRMSDT